MSYRSSAGWFWPDFDSAPPVPAATGAGTDRRSAALPPARFDRWAQPAPPPVRRSGEDGARAEAAAAVGPARPLTPASG